MRISVLIKKYKNPMIFLFIGFLLSGLSSTLLFDYLGSSFAFQDIIYMPLFLLLYKKFGISFCKNRSFSVFFVVWIILLILTPIFTDDLYKSMGVARNFLWIFFFAHVGRKVTVDDAFLDALFWISFGSTVCWCINGYIGINDVNYDDTSGANNGNMLALTYAIVLAFFYKKDYRLIIVLFLLNVFLSIVSGLRRQISVSFLSFVLSFLVINTKKVNAKSLLFFALGAVAIVVSLSYIEAWMSDFSPQLYTRIFLKSEAAFSGDLGESDQTRVDQFYYLFTRWDEIFIPGGFPPNNGLFIDTPTFLIGRVFGFIPACIYLIMLACKPLELFVNYIRGINDFYGVLLVICLVFFFLHFVEGSMFLFVYTVPFAGITLGLLFRRDIILHK